MRITNQFTFQQTISSYQEGAKDINKYNNQVLTGKLIQDSFENASVSINNGRLEYEAATVSQVEKATKSALEISKNTDDTMNSIVKELIKFKTKLLQAANDTNDITSRMAIVNELKEIKKGIINMANTSVNGQYLFAGTDLGTKPFDYEGNYQGNNEHIYVKTGAGIKAPYNIPGFDLFFSSDNDYNKLITTNMSFKDNRYTDADPDKQVFLDTGSLFADLVGQNYTRDKDLDPEQDFITPNTKLDFPPSALFVQGVKPDGSSFRASLFVEPDGTVGDMLKQIGALYGNSKDHKVVDVSLNASGQIEIKNLDAGDKMMEFHASAMNLQAQNAADFKAVLQAAQDEGWDPTRLMNETLNEAFMLNGNNNDVIHTQDIPSPINLTIGNQVFEVDLNTTPFIKSNMTDLGGNKADGVDYDNVYFNNEGNKLSSNSPQILRGTNEFATNATKLSEVSAFEGESLVGAKLNIQITSKAGTNYNISFDIANSSVSYTPDPNGGNQPVSFPITNEVYNDGTKSSIARRTLPNDISYQQVCDVIAMFSTDSQPANTINLQPNGTLTVADQNTINQGIHNANSLVNVGLESGKLTLTDRFSNDTDLKLAISSPPPRPGPGPALVAGDFPPMGTTNAQGAAFIFNANSAPVIDEPSISLIDDLQKMIDAVATGQMRADGDSNDPRNTGMQGGIKRLDHLMDHINKQHTRIGAFQNSIQETNERNSFLYVNVRSIQSEVAGVDLGEASMHLIQAQMSFQAALMASSKVSQLSLLNYM